MKRKADNRVEWKMAANQSTGCNHRERLFCMFLINTKNMYTSLMDNKQSTGEYYYILYEISCISQESTCTQNI